LNDPVTKRHYGTINIECIQGDITNQTDIDVVVNATNAQLMPGGGVAGAIHNKAGTGLAKECMPLAPIKTGEAVITNAHGLPNKYIIHCLGPIYGIDKPEEKLLASCYRAALNLAETYGLKSIAYPAISTGIFGYPLREAAEVSLTAIRDFKGYSSLKLVRLVLWSEHDRDLYAMIMNDVFVK